MSPLTLVGILVTLSPAICDVKHVLDGSAHPPEPNSISPHSVNNLASNPRDYWWMDSNSPLKAAYDYYKKCNTKGNCAPEANSGAPSPQPFLPQENINIDIKRNPFLSGSFNPSKGDAHYNSGGTKIDISKNPFLSGQVLTTGNGSPVVKNEEGFLGVQPAQPFKKPGFATKHPLEQQQEKKKPFSQKRPLEESAECKGAGFMCVEKGLCLNGVANIHGEGLLQVRSGVDYCADGEVCCRMNNLDEITPGKSSVPDSTIKFAGGAGFSPGLIHVQPLVVEPDVVFAGEHGHHGGATSKSVRDTSSTPSTVDYSDVRVGDEVRFGSTFQGPAYLPPLLPGTSPKPSVDVNQQFVPKPSPPEYLPPSPTTPRPTVSTSREYLPPSPTTVSQYVPSQQPYQPQKPYQPSVTPQQPYQPSVTPQQPFKPNVTPQRPYQPSITTQRPYQPSITSQQPYQPSISTQKPYQPSVTPQQPYQPSVTPQQPSVTPQRPYQPSITPQQPYQPNVTPQQPYQPSISTQKPYQPSVTPQQPYQPSVTPQQPSVTPQRPYQPSVTPQKPYQPSESTQKPYQPSVTPQQPYQPSVTPQRPYQPSITPQNPYQPSESTQKPYQPSATPQQPYQPSVTPQRPYQPSVTPQKPYQPSESTQKPYQPSVTPQQPYQPSVTPQRPYQPSVTPQQPYQPSITPQQPYQPSVTPQQPYQPSISTQQPYQPSISTQKPYQPSVTPQQPYQPQRPYQPSPPSISTQKPYQPSESTQRPYQPSVTPQKPYQPSVTPQQPYQPSSVRPTTIREYLPPSPQSPNVPQPSSPRPSSFLPQQTTPRPTPSPPQFTKPSPQPTNYYTQPSRPPGTQTVEGGYKYPTPTPIFEYPTSPRAGEGTNINTAYIPAPKPPTDNVPNPDNPIPDYASNPTPPTACAAALKCVQEIYCTAEGVISPVPVVLTKEQELSRVPTTECQDTAAGIVGKCCRDPTYKDPWPSANLVDGVDDGQYKEDDSIGQYQVDLQRSVRSSNASATCGRRNQNSKPRGPGPLDANFAEIPWQAMVLRDSNRSLLCGGVIIGRNAVLTAAHCVDGLPTNDILIKGGEWKLGIDDEPLPFQVISVAAVIRHPQYQKGSLLNDLAVLVLEERLRLSKNVGTLCLPPPNQIQTENCVVTGWGKRILQLHAKGAIMHAVDVKIMDNQQCQDTLSAKFENSVANYSPNTLCGFSNIDQCKVDYGSALACSDGTHYTLSGIFSWDTGCKHEGQIGGYVAPDVEWIESVLSKPVDQLRN